MSLEESILDKVRRLPAAKQQEVLRFADGLQRNVGARIIANPDRSEELKWIEAHRATYADQWVAIEGDRLIAAGEDALGVFAAAKAEGVSVPFVVHVLPDDSLPFVPKFAASPTVTLPTGRNSHSHQPRAKAPRCSGWMWNPGVCNVFELSPIVRRT